MSLQDLAPANSQKARKTSLNVFKRFLEAEATCLENVRIALLGDPSGTAFLRLMDRYAMHLAFSNGRGGQPLARNTVMGYYRHAKNWLLDDYPQQRQAIETKLLKMSRMLERYYLKRQDGGMIKKAPACTKDDLHSLIDGLYFDATTSKEYQDAALLLLMWYAFGRSSDLALVHKSSLTVSTSNVLYIRLIRVKTSEEQGLSLFPDQSNFITCPLHAIGVALAMQTFPIDSLLDHPHLNSE